MLISAPYTRACYGYCWMRCCGGLAIGRSGWWLGFQEAVNLVPFLLAEVLVHLKACSWYKAQAWCTSNVSLCNWTQQGKKQSTALSYNLTRDVALKNVGYVGSCIVSMWVVLWFLCFLSGHVFLLSRVKHLIWKNATWPYTVRSKQQASANIKRTKCVVP